MVMRMDTSAVSPAGSRARENAPALAHVALLLLALLALLLAGCGGPNAAVPTLVQPAQVQPAHFALTYVTIGASDAFGVGVDDPARQSWPVVLAGKLGTSVHAINLGIPGATANQALTQELPVALDAQPDLVAVLLGTNDIVSETPIPTFTQQLQALVLALRTRTSAHIYVGNLPNLTLLPYFAQDNLEALGATLRQMNAAIAAICQRDGATLVDLYSAWSDLAQHPEYVSSDGLHPSASGAARVAAIFYAAIQPAAPGQA